MGEKEERGKKRMGGEREDGVRRSGEKKGRKNRGRGVRGGRGRRRYRGGGLPFGCSDDGAASLF